MSHKLNQKDPTRKMLLEVRRIKQRSGTAMRRVKFGGSKPNKYILSGEGKNVR